VDGAVENDGTLVAFRGDLTIDGDVTGTGIARILNGGVLTLEAGFDQNVQFQIAGASGELVLADSQAYSASIRSFSATGATSLDLQDIKFVSTDEATFSKGVLTVTDGTDTAHIRLSGNFTGVTFTAASDGDGGTVITAAAGARPANLASAMAAMAPAGGDFAAASRPSTPPAALIALTTNAA
jgi:hypothetical protein